MESPPTLLRSTKLLWQLYLLCWWWWHLIWSPHWCKTGVVMSTLLFKLVWTGSCGTPLRIRSGHQIDGFFLLGRPGLRIWWSFTISISHTHRHIHEQAQFLNTSASQGGLNISGKKTEIMALNATNPLPVQIDNEEFLRQTDLPISAASLVEMKELTWTCRPTRPETRSTWLIRWGSPPLTVLVQSWTSSYHSCVLTTLLYGWECWRLKE